MGVQACRLPAPKRLKPLKPLKPLKLLKLCKSVSERPTAQAKATPKPTSTVNTPQTPQTLCKHRFGTPNRAGKSYPQATSMRNALLPQPTGYPKATSMASIWAVQEPAVRQAFALPTGMPNAHQCASSILRDPRAACQAC